MKNKILQAVAPFVFLANPAVAGSSFRSFSRNRPKKVVSQTSVSKTIEPKDSFTNPFAVFGGSSKITKQKEEIKNVLAFLEEEDLLSSDESKKSSISGDEYRKDFAGTAYCVASATYNGNDIGKWSTNSGASGYYSLKLYNLSFGVALTTISVTPNNTASKSPIINKIKAACQTSAATDYNVTTSTTLSADLNITGNLNISNNAIFDLSGKSVIVNGDINQTGGQIKINTGRLEVLGNYENNSSSIGNLVMQDINDYFYTHGNFKIDSNHNNGYLTNGTLQLDGNFTQLSSQSATSFTANTNHKVILSGNTKQTVSFSNSTSSYFNDLNITNTSSGGIDLLSNVYVANTYTSSANFQNDNGHTFTVNGIQTNFYKFLDTTAPTITQIYDRFRLKNASPFEVGFNVNDDSQGTISFRVFAITNGIITTTISDDAGVNLSLITSATIPSDDNITLTITPTQIGSVSFEISATDESNNSHSEFFMVNIQNQQYNDISAKENATTYAAAAALDVNASRYNLESWMDYTIFTTSQIVDYYRMYINSNSILSDIEIKDIDGIISYLLKPLDLPDTLKFDTTLDNVATSTLYTTHGMPFTFSDTNSISQKLYIKYTAQELKVDGDNILPNDSTVPDMNTFISELQKNEISYGLLRNIDRTKVLTLHPTIANQLIERDENQTTITEDAGSWSTDTITDTNGISYETLIINPTSSEYRQDEAFVLDVTDSKIKYAQYHAAGDIISHVMLNKEAKNELYHSISPNPKIEVPLKYGYNYISLPSSKLLCDTDIQSSISKCDQANTLESVFGANPYVGLVLKYGMDWLYWDNLSSSNPLYPMQKYSSISPLDGILVQALSDTTILLPFDEDSEVVNDYKNSFSEGWRFASNNKEQTVTEISDSLTAQNKTLVYILLLRDSVWHVYAPTNDAEVDSAMPRLSKVHRYESFWVYFR